MSNCWTLGGFVATRPTLKGDPQQCYFPFKFNGNTYRSCIELSAVKPFMNPSNPSELVQIPSLTSWCSLVPTYARTDGTKKMWGYCVCEDPLVTLQPTRPPTSAITVSPTIKPSISGQISVAPTRRPSTKGPTQRPSLPAVPQPTKQPVRQPTRLQTLSPTVLETPSPTAFPTFVTAAPVLAPDNVTSIEEMLSDPIIAASIGVGGSFVLFGLFFALICLWKRLKKSRKRSTSIVAYPPSAASSPKSATPTPLSSAPRRFPLARPRWGGSKDGDEAVGEDMQMVISSEPPIAVPPLASAERKQKKTGTATKSIIFWRSSTSKQSADAKGAAPSQSANNTTQQNKNAETEEDLEEKSNLYDRKEWFPPGSSAASLSALPPSIPFGRSADAIPPPPRTTQQPPVAASKPVVAVRHQPMAKAFAQSSATLTPPQQRTTNPNPGSSSQQQHQASARSKPVTIPPSIAALLTKSATPTVPSQQSTTSSPQQPRKPVAIPPSVAALIGKPVGGGGGGSAGLPPSPPVAAPVKAVVVPPSIIKAAQPAPSKGGQPADVEKYKKMLRIGLSHDAIRHAMAKDGVPLSMLPELG